MDEITEKPNPLQEIAPIIPKQAEKLKVSLGDSLRLTAKDFMRIIAESMQDETMKRLPGGNSQEKWDKLEDIFQANLPSIFKNKLSNLNQPNERPV